MAGLGRDRKAGEDARPALTAITWSSCLCRQAPLPLYEISAHAVTAEENSKIMMGKIMKSQNETRMPAMTSFLGWALRPVVVMSMTRRSSRKRAAFWKTPSDVLSEAAGSQEAPKPAKACQLLGLHCLRAPRRP